MHRLLLALVLLGALTPAAPATLEPESLAALRFVSDAQISPDGRRIVYVVSRMDVPRDRYLAELWLIEDEGAPRPLVTASGENTRPRWSPDGRRLAFLSDRSGSQQILVLELGGGEAWSLTAEPKGVGAFAWSPDGTQIAYLARSGEPAAERTARNGQAPQGAGRALVTERLFFRADGTPGFVPEVRSRLRVIAARGRAAPSAPLTDGYAEPSAPAWSPDGRWIYFSALPRSEEAEIDGDTELFRVPADGSGAAEPLAQRRGPDRDPLVSAAGHLAWVGFDIGEPVRSSSTTHLHVMRPDGSERRVLTGALDRNVGETLLTDAAAPRSSGQQLVFTARGGHLLFVAADRGRTRLFRVATDGGPIESLSDELQGDLREISVARTGRIAAIFGSPTQPYEVWTLERAGGKWARRTAHGIDSLARHALAGYEELWVDSFDGRRIQGWLIRPPGFDPSRKYPLILYIHGGPHALYGESFFHEFQMLASAGFLVLITNPRGSTGYGQEFANVIQHRYPGDDHRDLMAALDAVLARGFADERRLGIAGGSGGGVLTSWTIGRTERFAAALVERPVTNWLSFAVASDRSAYFVRYWFRDYPWRDAEDYLARSPLSLVDAVRTPVLVIQSEQDYRTPVDQGLQYYTALRMLGKEARLALFPASAHGLSREGPPGQRVERLRIIREWFAGKLGAEGR